MLTFGVSMVEDCELIGKEPVCVCWRGGEGLTIQVFSRETYNCCYIRLLCLLVQTSTKSDSFACVFFLTVWDPIMCALAECTSSMFCIWVDDGSMSRNTSPNF